MRQIATCLEMTADGDQIKLATTGFDLRRDAARSYALAGGAATGSALLEAPREFRIGLGGRSGTLEINAINVAGAISYEVQISQGDPSAEAGQRADGLN